ncbi:MAG TPA: insulinase family protein [Polyangia bacterium]
MRLSNGLSVQFSFRQLSPVWIALQFPGGRSTDPPTRIGRAVACLNALADDTNELTSSSTDATVTVFVDPVRHGFRVRTSKAALDQTLARLSTIFERRFVSPGKLASFVAARRLALAQARAQPLSAAEAVQALVAFGGSHPEGSLETAETLGRITLDDCAEFLSRHLQPENAELIAVGDVDAKHFEQRLRARLDRLGSPTKASSSLARLTTGVEPFPPIGGGRIHFIDVGQTSAVVMMALSFTPAEDPAAVAASTLVAVGVKQAFAEALLPFAYRPYGTIRRFSGTDVRVYWALIESQGLISALKAASAGFGQVKRYSPALLSTPDVRGAATFELIADLDRAEGLMSFFSGEYAIGAEGRLLPAGWASEVLTRLTSVGPSEIRTAQERISPDRMVYLVAGDGRALLPQLEALVKEGLPGLAALVVVKAD